MSQEQAPQTETPQEASGEAKLVPVAESIKYRRRAQQAEATLETLQQQLTEIKKQVTDQQTQLGAAEAQRDEAALQLIVTENNRTAERVLAEAGTVDIETAAMLLGKKIDLAEVHDVEAIGRSVEELLLDKPYLRQPIAAGPPKTASARPAQTGSIAQMTQAADRAITTGDRRDVAEYLRLRRLTANH